MYCLPQIDDTLDALAPTYTIHLILQELDLHIYYRPSKENANANTLSRPPIATDLANSQVHTNTFEHLLADPEMY